jgi:hypothetical protein
MYEIRGRIRNNYDTLARRDDPTLCIFLMLLMDVFYQQDKASVYATLTYLVL